MQTQASPKSLSPHESSCLELGTPGNSGSTYWHHYQTNPQELAIWAFQTFCFHGLCGCVPQVRAQLYYLYSKGTHRLADVYYHVQDREATLGCPKSFWPEFHDVCTATRSVSVSDLRSSQIPGSRYIAQEPRRSNRLRILQTASMEFTGRRTTNII